MAQFHSGILLICIEILKQAATLTFLKNTDCVYFVMKTIENEEYFLFHCNFL